MASIPSNGYREVMAGTNVYTGSNFFGSDCPKTPIAPTDPDDLVNRAYVTSVIPPTPPVTEFSYTNASNAIVPVAAPTASLQKLNLLASGVNPGIWSVLNLTGLTPLGAPSAVLIRSNGEFWVATLPFGGAQNVPLLLRYSSDLTTLLGYSYADNAAHNARINAIYEFNGSIYIGGNFERVGANIDPIGIVQYNIARFDPPFIFSQAPTQLGGGGINGVNGEVNAIWVGEVAALNYVLIAGGIGITATLPTALGSPVNNLIVMSGAINPANTQSFSSCGGAFRVDGGGVNTLLGVTLDAGIFIGGSFLTVGSSFISQPAFTRIDCLTGGGYGILIGSINGAVQDICFSTRVPALIQDVILVAGLFDLTAFGGSNGTCYFTISTNLISPAVALNPAVGGYKVNSVGGRDAVIFGGTSILMTNSVLGSTYWNNQGAAGNAGSAVALQSILFSGDFWLGATSDVGFLRKYTAAVAAPVATFQLPTARFRSATAPNNQYQNAVFSTAAGAQVFISGADLFWSPAGALTTGLTFS